MPIGILLPDSPGRVNAKEGGILTYLGLWVAFLILLPIGLRMRTARKARHG